MHKGDDMISKRMIEVFVEEWCKNSRIEVVESFDWDEEKHDIIEFNLYDYLDNHKKFETDVNHLIEYLEEILDADIFVGKPNFKYLPDIDDNGNEIKKYHCSLIVGKNC